MSSRHWFFLFAALSFVGMSIAGFSNSSYAAESSRSGSGNPSVAIVGTWHSEKETLRFNKNGTIVYKGKSYYYAVSTGGTIQLTGKHGGLLAFPYQLAGGKLTLTVNGKPTVYTRR